MGFVAVIGAGLIASQIVVGIAFALAGAMAHSRIEWAQMDSNGLFLSLSTCVSTPFIVGLAWLFASLRKGLPARQYLALNRVSPWTVGRWCSVLLLVIVLSDSLTTILGRPIVPQFMRDIYASAGFLPLLWFGLVVMAPIGEEVVVRGFLFQGVLQSLGGIAAILISSALWAGIHLQYDLYGISQVFLSGLVLGYARWKTNSIYPGIVMHGFMNLLATLELVLQQQFLSGR